MKSSISRIWLPIWKCNPWNETLLISFVILITSSMCAISIPNLFSDKPVVMFACVCAPTLGLMRRQIFTTLPFCLAIVLMTSSSGMLSTLKHRILLSIPSSISQSAFPTPANTILSAGNPAFSDTSISPPLTQSIPNPASNIGFSTMSLAFALIA